MTSVVDIYKLTNKCNGLIYIGRTSRDVSKRIAEHKYKRSLVGQAILDFGISAFKVEIIDHAESVSEGKEKERFWISKYNSFAPHGYNLALGDSKFGAANGFFGKSHKTETILCNKSHQKHSKRVLQLDSTIIYPSIRACARALGISKAHVSRICKGLIRNTNYHLKFSKSKGECVC